jgi:hypothetical protein
MTVTSELRQAGYGLAISILLLALFCALSGVEGAAALMLAAAAAVAAAAGLPGRARQMRGQGEDRLTRI